MRLLLTGMCIAACVAFVPGARAIAEVRLTPFVTLSETFSDNIDQDPDGSETSAIVSDVVPALDLRWQSARVTAAADAAVTFRHQTKGEDEGIEILPALESFGTVEVSRDLFFVDGAAAVSQQLLNTRENDSESNRDTIQNYSLSPYLVSSFGGFADGELRYRFDQVLNSGADDQGLNGNSQDSLSDETVHSVSASLDSGVDFTRLTWSLDASASESNRSNDDDISRRDVTLGLEYVVARWLSVLGSGGYQQFDDGDPGNEIDGPTWDAGISLRPGPRTELRATYGKGNGEQSLNANLTYRIGPRTTLVASYAEHLETGQERIIEDLRFISTDPDTGNLIDSRTGLAFDPNTSTTSLQDETTRTKTLNVALHGTRGRNSFQVGGTVESSKEEGVNSNNEEEDSYRVSAGWQRRLSRRTDISIFGSYERNEFVTDNRTDNEYRVGGRLNYVVFRNIDAFASYRFAQQTSTNDADEFTENLLTVGLQMTF